MKPLNFVTFRPEILRGLRVHIAVMSVPDRDIEFVSSGRHDMSVETANNPKKSAMFDLRTGRPLEIPEGDLYGRCRCVSATSAIDLVMNTMN